jgi:hypothetical protein
MVTDATPVFVVAGVVLGALALWAVWVNFRIRTPWAIDRPEEPAAAKPSDEAEKPA